MKPAGSFVGFLIIDMLDDTFQCIDRGQRGCRLGLRRQQMGTTIPHVFAHLAQGIWHLSPRGQLFARQLVFVPRFLASNLAMQKPDRGTSSYDSKKRAYEIASRIRIYRASSVLLAWGIQFRGGRTLKGVKPKKGDLLGPPSCIHYLTAGQMESPPSIVNEAPVMYPASGPAKNATAAATSSGSP